MFSPASLQALVTALQGAGMRASLDPADVALPGAWVTMEGFQAVNVRGHLRVDAMVYLIVEDADYLRAYEGLAALYNQVVPGVIRPDGRVITQAVVLPDSSTALPALRVPVSLYESE